MKNKWILLAVLGISIIAFFSWKKNSSAPKTENLSIEKPALPTMLKGVGSLGRIEPRSRVVSLSHDAGPEGARIEILHVAEGDVVKKGDLIATFSDLERKKAKLTAMQAKIPMQEAMIAAELANVKFYERDYKRAAKLIKTRTISPARLDEADKNYQQTLAKIDSLRAELNSTKADLVLSEKELQQAQLFSSIDGTILKIHSWQGERVNDKGVAEIADLSQMDVVAEIYERDMSKVQVGQKAEIKVSGVEKTINGEVRELGFLVRKNDLNDTDPLADRDNRIVEVRISLPPEVSEQLKHLIFMQVDVRLL